MSCRIETSEFRLNISITSRRQTQIFRLVNNNDYWAGKWIYFHATNFSNYFIYLLQVMIFSFIDFLECLRGIQESVVIYELSLLRRFWGFQIFVMVENGWWRKNLKITAWGNARKVSRKFVILGQQVCLEKNKSNWRILWNFSRTCWQTAFIFRNFFNLTILELLPSETSWKSFFISLRFRLIKRRPLNELVYIYSFMYLI